MKPRTLQESKAALAGFINKIDPSLSKYQEMDLFKDKAEEVAALISKAGLPGKPAKR